MGAPGQFLKALPEPEDYHPVYHGIDIPGKIQ